MNQLFPLSVAVPLMTAAVLLAFRPLLQGRQVRGVIAVAASASVAVMLLVLTLKTGAGSACWFAGFHPTGGVAIGIDFTADPLNAGLACLGALLMVRGRLIDSRRFLFFAVWLAPLPFVLNIAGWMLTENGRQPWIVQGLLKTSEANSPSVSTTWLAISLGVFIALYVTLGVVDFVLMRRYARPDLPASREEMPEPVVTY